jgi:transposase
VPSKLTAHHGVIRAQVKAVPDMTIAELRAWLLANHGIPVSHAVMWETLRRLELTLKKDPTRCRTGTSGCRGP